MAYIQETLVVNMLSVIECNNSQMLVIVIHVHSTIVAKLQKIAPHNVL